jgi:FAD/FMN-containing dehydrogenase
MDQVLIDELKTIVKGSVLTDEANLKTYSHDASLFEVIPQVVVCPEDDEDVKALVRFVAKHKKDHPNLSLTGRAAGTDMSGGSVNDSILVSFTQHFNKKPQIDVKNQTATFQPGMYYRDFEKATLKHNLLFPSYPASRELCAMGGIVNNNSGGEKSLKYGKTERYITEVTLVLRDGNEYTFGEITEDELAQKMKQKDLEGEIYRDMYALINKHYDKIMAAKPTVSKNSAGYFLWNVWDKEKKTFNLAQLIIGSQGTFGLMTKAKTRLVPTTSHHHMMVIFLYDLKNLGKIIETGLALEPESFEAYDDNTLKLALKFFPEFAKLMGAKGFIDTGVKFIPEFMLVAKRRRLPKMVLQIEFTGDDEPAIDGKMAELESRLRPLNETMRTAIDDEGLKYWLIRRDSFSLLRKKVKDLHTAPFIDDFSVEPKYLAEFLPQVNKMFKRYPKLIYTIAGHVGDGNFHIIPLMKIEDPKQRKIIPVLSKKVYDLVLKYGGTIDSEHNDGLIRTPYLEQQYGKEMVKLFEQTKDIFDPENIFNPRKKVRSTLEYAMKHIRTSW